METNKLIYKGIWILLGFAIIYTAGFMLKVCNLKDPFLLSFLAWACLPFLILAGFGRMNRESSPSLVVVLVTMLAITGASLYMLFRAFVTHPDAQSGLIFVFLPFYQIIASIIGGIIACVVKAIR
jgi:predicted permease